MVGDGNQTVEALSTENAFNEVKSTCQRGDSSHSSGGHCCYRHWVQDAEGMRNGRVGYVFTVVHRDRQRRQC